MRWSRILALGVLALLIGGWLVLQVPLLHAARGWAWGIFQTGLAQWLDIGLLTVPNSVADQLARLQSENVRLRMELKDYKRLRAQLGLRSFDDFTAIPAYVLAMSLDPFHSRLVIGRGTRAGVTLGAPVVVNGSTLVGFISALHEETAILQLLYHPATSLPAEVDNAAGSRGLLQGKAFTALLLSSVPRDKALRVGDTVVTVHRRPDVPGGLLIGRVSEVTDEPHEPFLQARVEALFDPDALYAVAVLVPKLP